MTWSLLQTAGWLFLAAVVGVLLHFLLHLIVWGLRQRTLDLRDTAKYLATYEKALDKLLDDPVTPRLLRALLLEFDHGVMHRGAANFVGKGIFRDRASWVRPEKNESPVEVELRELRKHRPDLYEGFATAINAGFRATMLRWSFPSAALRFLLVDPRRDPVTPARAVACGADKNHHDHHGGALPQAV